jgi:hypothetical protein
MDLWNFVKQLASDGVSIEVQTPQGVIRGNAIVVANGRTALRAGTRCLLRHTGYGPCVFAYEDEDAQWQYWAYDTILSADDISSVEPALAA